MTKTEKKKYPIGAEFYELYEEVGHGVSAHVRRARCLPLNEIVAVKILDFERDNSDLVPPFNIYYQFFPVWFQVLFINLM